MFSLIDRNRIHVREFTDVERSRKLALLAFNGKIKDNLLRQFKTNYSVEGDPIRNGGAISPSTILTLAAASGGALGTSAAASGTLFMATANPATLMAIGSGVGSAVMGAGGIVAQAPFIAVTGALMPVLAPLLAFQVISTLMIMSKFKGIHDRLNEIEKSISRVLQRAEATYVGELISASNRLDDLEIQLELGNRFTNEMIIRLALLEDKVNPIFERYKFLYQSESIQSERSLQDLKFKQNDAYFALLLSITDLKVDFLRLKLSAQENPGYMEIAVERLIAKVGHYKEMWAQIANDATLVEEVASQLRQGVTDMNWWGRTMPKALLGKRSKRISTEQKAGAFSRHAEGLAATMAQEIDSAIIVGEQAKQALSGEKHLSLIYWRDEIGEHSYYTDDLELIPAVA